VVVVAVRDEDTTDFAVATICLADEGDGSRGETAFVASDAPVAVRPVVARDNTRDAASGL
jgi:hypothetical protein